MTKETDNRNQLSARNQPQPSPKENLQIAAVQSGKEVFQSQVLSNNQSYIKENPVQIKIDQQQNQINKSNEEIDKNIQHLSKFVLACKIIIGIYVFLNILKLFTCPIDGYDKMLSDTEHALTQLAIGTYGYQKKNPLVIKIFLITTAVGNISGTVRRSLDTEDDARNYYADTDEGKKNQEMDDETLSYYKRLVIFVLLIATVVKMVVFWIYVMGYKKTKDYLQQFEDVNSKDSNKKRSSVVGSNRSIANSISNNNNITNNNNKNDQTEKRLCAPSTDYSDINITNVSTNIQTQNCESQPNQQLLVKPESQKIVIPSQAIENNQQ